MKKPNLNKQIFLTIIVLTTFFTSCTQEELDIDSEINETSELKYNYDGKTFSADIFEVNNNDILSNSYQVYDVNNETVYLFDSQKKADEYSDSLITDSTIEVSEINESNITKAKEIEFCGKSLLSFKVKLFSKKKFEGKSILFVLKNVNVEEERKVKLKLPNFWKSKASSMIVKASELASTVNKNGKCKKTPPIIAAFSIGESEKIRLLRMKILNKETGKTVLRFSNLRKQEANNAIDMLTIFY